MKGDLLLKNRQVSEFIKALEEGMVCLHPSDTLPGLSFHPEREKPRQSLYKLKKRPLGKKVVSLVSSPNKARSFWQPLPLLWERALDSLWPASLTLVWKASSQAPFSLVSETGLLAQRCPEFSSELAWMKDVLEALSYPLPSTSVNLSQEKSSMTWEGAVSFCQNHEGIYIPSFEKAPSFADLSSTILLLKEDGFDCLREGSVSLESVEEILRKTKKEL